MKLRLEMDEVKLATGPCPGVQGQQLKPIFVEDESFNEDLTHVLGHIDLVSKEILKYLDGSALINLSSVNRKIREVVTSSVQYKKLVNINLRVETTKNMDIFTSGPLLVPLWDSHLTHLTIVCNSELDFISQVKFSSLARKTLHNLSSLEVINEFIPYTIGYITTFINKILRCCSSNLKSLSLPYDLMLSPNIFDHQFIENLQELKFTTSTYKIKFNNHFQDNIKILATKCLNLKSFACQELATEGNSVKLQEFVNWFENGILTIIDKNSESLEKLEFGIFGLVVDYRRDRISLPNLKFLDLKIVMPKMDRIERSHESVPLILNQLPIPEQLTTLKLTSTIFPLDLFELIPEKFHQLKSLSLKSSRFDTSNRSDKTIDENFWSLLQSLTQLEELDIENFKVDDTANNFGLKTSDKFQDFLQNVNLRKLSLKSAFHVHSSTIFNMISEMSNLKELSLTGCPIYLNDILSICTNLKILEKLEISHLLANKFNPQTTHTDATGGEINNSEISIVFSSLRYLRELSIEELSFSGDFLQVLGTIKFPYIKSLTLPNTQLGKKEVENIVGLSGMLKKLSIVTLKEGYDFDPATKLDIVNERNNLQIEFITKQVSEVSGGGTKLENSIGVVVVQPPLSAINEVELDDCGHVKGHLGYYLTGGEKFFEAHQPKGLSITLANSKESETHSKNTSKDLDMQVKVSDLGKVFQFASAYVENLHLSSINENSYVKNPAELIWSNLNFLHLRKMSFDTWDMCLSKDLEILLEIGRPSVSPNLDSIGIRYFDGSKVKLLETFGKAGLLPNRLKNLSIAYYSYEDSSESNSEVGLIHQLVQISNAGLQFKEFELKAYLEVTKESAKKVLYKPLQKFINSQSKWIKKLSINSFNNEFGDAQLMDTFQWPFFESLTKLSLEMDHYNRYCSGVLEIPQEKFPKLEEISLYSLDPDDISFSGIFSTIQRLEIKNFFYYDDIWFRNLEKSLPNIKILKIGHFPDTEDVDHPIPCSIWAKTVETISLPSSNLENLRFLNNFIGIRNLEVLKAKNCDSKKINIDVSILRMFKGLVSLKIGKDLNISEESFNKIHEKLPQITIEN